jgi:hypothetical protein
MPYKIGIQNILFPVEIKGVTMSRFISDDMSHSLIGAFAPKVGSFNPQSIIQKKLFLGNR